MRIRESVAIKIILGITLSLVFTFTLIFSFLAWRQQHHTMAELAIRAQTIADSLTMIRHWVASYEGVWVEENSAQDAAGSSRISFKDPSMVTSELSPYAEKTNSFQFRLTSLNPLNQENVPDTLEREALLSFERGALRFDGFEQNNNRTIYRYIVPLLMEESCLNCHGQQGYKAGDLRGALSLRLPVEDTLLEVKRDYFSFALLGLLATALLSTLLYFLLRRLILNPLRALEYSTAILSNDLSYRVIMNTGDEFERLGHGLNRLASELQGRYTELKALETENQELENDFRKLYEQASRDGLTGLFNHATFQQQLKDELERAFLQRKPLSLLMLDLDHFKRLNDNRGHQAGDLMLREVSMLIHQDIREDDFPARYGGEELAIILPGCPKGRALKIADRIRRNVETHSVDYQENPLRVTVSVGVACFPDDAGTTSCLIGAADSALYRAKSLGRNMVVSYTEENTGKGQ